MGLKSFFGGVVARLLSLGRRPVQKGDFVCEGLECPVTITVDEWGVPHIKAQSQRDLSFAIGFFHAKERLFQMEIVRRVAKGELSSFAGEEALPLDKLARTLGFARLGCEDANLLDPSSEDAVLLQAYLDGINAFLKSRAFKRPVEFTLAGLQESPFTLEDIFTFSRLVGFQMSYGWYEPLIRQLITDKIGEEKAKQFGFVHPRDIPTTLPKGDIEINVEPLRAIGQGQGSNSWAVSGQFTDTGKPYLCADPHLEVTLPCIWMEMHLTVENEKEVLLDAAGVGFPLIPTILIGHNTHITWGITLSFCKVADMYFETVSEEDPSKYMRDGEAVPFETFEEVIQVKDKPSVTMTARRSCHGPVLQGVLGEELESKYILSIRAVYLESSKSLAESHRDASLLELELPIQPLEDVRITPTAAFDLLRARNFEEFSTAVRGIHSFSLNISYADTDGNIGYQCCGAIPIRRENQPGDTLLDGSTSRTDWVGLVPFDRLPCTLNPEQGWVITCNHRLIDEETYPYYLGNLWLNGYRAKRVQEVLQSLTQDGGKVTRDHMETLLHDYVSTAWPKFLACIQDIDVSGLPAHEQQMYELLLTFDGDMQASSAPACIYEVLKSQLARSLWQDLIGEDLCSRLLGKEVIHLLKADSALNGNDVNMVLKLLEGENESGFGADGSLSRSDIILQALHLTYEKLRATLGRNIHNWRWGKIHQITFKHALGPAVSIFNRGPYPLGGDGETVNNTLTSECHSFYKPGMFVPSWRQIVDLSDFSRSLCCLPTGQSGHRGSTHYDNQIPLWVGNRMRSFLWTKEQVAGATVSKIFMSPPQGEGGASSSSASPSAPAPAPEE